MPAVGDELALTPHELLTITRLDDELLEFDARWSPGSKPPPSHLHPAQDERFVIREGVLTVVVDKLRSELHPGESVEIPKDTVHRMWNAGSEAVRATWQVRPPGRTPEFFAAMAARPDQSVLGAAALLEEYRDVFRLAVPELVQRPLVKALGAIGRRRSS